MSMLKEHLDHRAGLVVSVGKCPALCLFTSPDKIWTDGNSSLFCFCRCVLVLTKVLY